MNHAHCPHCGDTLTANSAVHRHCALCGEVKTEPGPCNSRFCRLATKAIAAVAITAVTITATLVAIDAAGVI